MSQMVRKTSRREFLSKTTAATGAIAFSRFVYGPDTSCSSTLPNIVMIISDDQGWGDYGFMGHPTIRTPYLDRLASQSAVFSRGYVASPLCCPSLASIITGLHPHQHRITSNDPPPRPTDRLAMREEMISHIDMVPTLPKILAQLGYESLQTGKWWFGDYSRGGFTNGMTHGYPDRGGRHGDAGLVIGRETMQPIFDFIDNNTNRPFFIWYAPMMPHLPHNPPESLLSFYSNKTESIHIARYWAMCEWFDETCGQLLDHLDSRGLAASTLVIFVCDNGWIQSSDSSRFGLRSKRTSYEGGIRTPIMISWPGNILPRRDDDTLVSSIDLAPTVLTACGLNPTPGMEGLNILNVRALESRDTIFGAAYSHDARSVHEPSENLESRWVIRGWWKLIQPIKREDTRSDPELYDLGTDPNEEYDLAAVHPELVNELSALCNRWYSESEGNDFQH